MKRYTKQEAIGLIRKSVERAALVGKRTKQDIVTMIEETERANTESKSAADAASDDRSERDGGE